MNLILKRYAYMHSCTLGALGVGDHALFTIERPWIRHTEIGGMPFQSCIPDGEYTMTPYTRPNGDDVYLISNPDLGVFVNAADRPDGVGRYKVEIHSGNWVDDIVGCIAPGLMYKIDYKGRHMVTSSRAAMRVILAELRQQLHHTITIENVTGAVD